MCDEEELCWTFRKGDTAIPIAVITLFAHDARCRRIPDDIDDLTVLFSAQRLDGEFLIPETSDGVEKQPATPFLASIENSTLEYDAPMPWKDGTCVVLSSTGILPAPLESGKRYYTTKGKDNGFQLSAEPRGTAITFEDFGSGEHSFKALGEVRFTLQSSHVAAAGRYKCWFIFVYPDGKRLHNPSNGQMWLEILD